MKTNVIDKLIGEHILAFTKRENKIQNIQIKNVSNSINQTLNRQELADIQIAEVQNNVNIIKKQQEQEDVDMELIFSTVFNEVMFRVESWLEAQPKVNNIDMDKLVKEVLNRIDYLLKQ